MIVAVADAGPIIHLAEVDAMALLDTVDELILPETVRSELRAGGVPEGFADLTVEAVSVDEAVLQSRTDLDEGETAALTVARNRDAVLLTDDLAAREAAKASDVEVHGSIGVVALAFGRERLREEQAVDLMRSLQTETSLFVTEAVVEHGIELIRGDNDGSPSGR
ncbi:nucleic acid-binding protein [Halolamina rubra]|uniref:nucleic acid-binding protein n=1 Tax=Halolamina rubra TaxID=1380430 RepID=UPI0009E4C505|nr:nucleic acid-binding protein [Halolamina rubra]